MFKVWPDGLERLQGLLDEDLARAARLWDSYNEFPRFAAATANLLYSMLFRVTGIHDMGVRFAEGAALSIPDTIVRDTYIANVEAIRLTMVGTQLFGIRLATLLMATPMLALAYLVALTDGLVQRAVRRASGGREALEITAASGERIGLQKISSPDAQEVRLYCHSPGREQNERAIIARLIQRFEQGLAKISQALKSPRGEKRLTHITERIGRLKQNCFGIGQHYQIEYRTDASGNKLTGLAWTKHVLPGSQVSDSGVYCLRSNETTWSAEQLWRTYVMLTDLEPVFRSLKSELGLRPIFHHKQMRSDAHLFISVLAYQFVQIIRTRLADRGIHDSWISLRQILRVQRRTTSCFTTRAGHTLSVRKASRPEAALAQIYSALALHPNPGGTRKLITSGP